jgi:predicted deacylase
MANRELVVGNLSARPGEKKVGVQEIMVQGMPYTFPMFLINGGEEGPALAVTGGIHGGEYASIAAALDLGRRLEPKALRGRVIIAPVVNMPAFRARSIYICPLDGVNLNRVFPGKADGSASEQIADWVFRNVIKQGNYYADLHGGDLVEALVPFTIFNRTGNEAVDRTALEMAKVFGIRYVVRSDAIGGSAYSAAAHAGIPAILTEAGAQGIWLPEAVALHTNGLNRLMRHLGMLAGPAPDPLPSSLLDQFIWLRSEHDGFWYPKPSVDDAVHKGQDLGAVTDFQGNVLQAIKSPADGRVLFLVSSLAINKGDPLLAVGA